FCHLLTHSIPRLSRLSCAKPQRGPKSLSIPARNTALSSSPSPQRNVPVATLKSLPHPQNRIRKERPKRPEPTHNETTSPHHTQNHRLVGMPLAACPSNLELSH